ncbi:hypothetical protein PE067_09235 [Paracoccus sp. DMF-8]|uniref:hypothetical protein n=1 Tax=Paracoccus sp. DMF-8 TaxID=3019445 RepID=UPI0023E8E5DF|nr:hypothetical protein [Paracoccus sp. DMF-8]MDF3606301.1 hypothetical protein [Paracoccus sp. DMF-8]
MAKKSPTLLQKIEAFLSETGMGESYFGKKSVGNSELVSRLRQNRRVWPETEAKAISFMLSERSRIRSRGYVPATPTQQPAPAEIGRKAVR